MNILKDAKVITDNLKDLGQYLCDELRTELKGQNFSDTGSLAKSIDYAVEFYQNGLRLMIEYNRYGAIVNNGIKPNRIPFGSGNGGSSSQYIQALAAWVQRKGIESDEKKALGVAFAIANTQKKEGYPTRGSYKFSNNGRRGKFQDYVLAQNEAKISETIGQGAELEVIVALDNILSKIKNAA